MSNKNIKDKDIQVVIGNLLRYGIWSALFVSVTGGIIYLIRHSQEAVHYGAFEEKHHNLFQLIGSTLKEASGGSGRNIIMTGILLLFLTPVLRIIFSLIAFILERDHLYVVITIIVIIIITLSVIFGFSH